MPCLNHVFEELEVQHQERLVPAKVLKSVAEKERKAVMKNVTVMAEAMERKVSGRGKVISKKWKPPPLLPPLVLVRRWRNRV